MERAFWEGALGASGFLEVPGIDFVSIWVGRRYAINTYSTRFSGLFYSASLHVAQC